MRIQVIHDHVENPPKTRLRLEVPCYRVSNLLRKENSVALEQEPSVEEQRLTF